MEVPLLGETKVAPVVDGDNCLKVTAEQAKMIGKAAVEHQHLSCVRALYWLFLLLEFLLPPFIAVLGRLHKQGKPLLVVAYWYEEQRNCWKDKLLVTCLLAITSGIIIDGVARCFCSTWPKWWFVYVRGWKRWTPIGAWISDGKDGDGIEKGLKDKAGDAWGFDHLQMGMTRYAMRDVAEALLHGYERKQSDFEKKFGPDFAGYLGELATKGIFPVGYDLIRAIKDKLRAKKLEQPTYSIAEVMFALGHPGVVLLSAFRRSENPLSSNLFVFVSHVQAEAVQDTFTALKNYAHRTWNVREPYFWIDYFMLRQLTSDFILKKISVTIEALGRTLLISESVEECPNAMKRTFCVYEMYCTLKAKKTLCVMPIAVPGFCQKIAPHCCRTDFEVDMKHAQCSNEEDRKAINEKIEEEITFDKANEQVKKAITNAYRKFACYTFFRVSFWWFIISLSVLTGVVFYMDMLVFKVDVYIIHWELVDVLQEWKWLLAVSSFLVFLFWTLMIEMTHE